VIWVAVGGRGTLVGAALGAIVRQTMQDVLSPRGALAPYWLFMLGAMFILVTLLLPKGIVGTFNAWWEPWRAGESRLRPKVLRAKTASANPIRRSERMNVMDTRATSALLYLDGVHVSFDGFHAINNLSLTLAPGEMRAIIGPNGRRRRPQ